jgi:hypothetical protein
VLGMFEVFGTKERGCGGAIGVIRRQRLVEHTVLQGT